MQLFTADSGLFEVSFQLIEKKKRFLMSSVFLVFFFFVQCQAQEPA